MFGLGIPELALILVIALVIFGPGKLSSLGKALGHSVREFKAETTDNSEKAAPGETTNA